MTEEDLPKMIHFCFDSISFQCVQQKSIEARLLVSVLCMIPKSEIAFVRMLHFFLVKDVPSSYSYKKHTEQKACKGSILKT